MRVRELESFVAVAEELHFGRAAARLNLAQQPLSQNIRKLEERLGVTLFQRTTRSVSLSSAGEAYLPNARSALRLLREGRDAAQQAARGATDRLIVGYVESALNRLLPPIFQALRDTQPGCALDLRQGCSSELLSMLVAHELDAAVFVSGTSLQATQTIPDGLLLREVAREQVMVALPAAHPLAQGRPIPLKALQDQAWVMYSPTQKTSLRDQIYALCKHAGFVPRVAQEADSESLILSLVASGIGLALVPQDAASTRRHDVVYLSLCEPEVSLIYSLAWAETRSSPALQTLLELTT